MKEALFTGAVLSFTCPELSGSCVRVVGRTHIIVRFQTGNRRKDNGTENFGGFVYVLDRFPQRDLGLWTFMYPINFTYFFFYFFFYFTANTPRATTPHLYRTGHHAFTTTAQLSRLCISRLPRQGLPRPILTTTGYHACVFIQVITPELSRSTIHVHRVITPAISNSYFIVLSFTGFYATTSNLLSLAHTARTHSTQWTASSDGWLVRCSPVDRMFVLSRI